MLARKISWMMGGAIALTVLMVAASVFWTARQNNIKATEDSRLMIAGGIKSVAKRLEALNFDYAAWDAALSHSLARDVEWLTENIALGAEGDQFDMAQITWPEDWSSMSWTDAMVQTPADRSIFPDALVRRLHAALQGLQLGNSDTISFVQSVDDVFFLVSTARVQLWNRPTTTPPDRLPILIMGLRLSPERVAEIGQTYLIDDLELAAEPVPGMASSPLHNLEGRAIAHLHWTPPRPGRDLVRIASIPLAVALLAYFLLSGVVLVLARRSALELVRREGEASKIARTDPLTGMPNRLAFYDDLEGRKSADEDCAILFLDLNGFKSVNDTYGHQVGDALIVEIGTAIGRARQPEDFAARVGGDEFNIVCTGKDAEARCRRLCEVLGDIFARSISVEGISFQPHVAMGYAVGRPSETRLTELLRQADVAMFKAKNQRRRTPLKYTPEIEEDSKYETEISNALVAAVGDGGEFELVYQPVFDARTGRHAFAEALLRWQSRSLGTVAPDIFIPIAERCGLIMEISNWVINRAFSDMADNPTLEVSINLSPVQLRYPGIAKHFRDLAAHHRVDPARATLELTEGTLIEDPETAGMNLDALRDLGFRIALDDFGTGFSSIGYLRQFKFDKLKIDKSFLEDLEDTGHGRDMMGAFVHLARSFDMDIVAEGVETVSQLGILRDAGFDLIQGYLLSRPVRLGELCKVGMPDHPERESTGG